MANVVYNPTYYNKSIDYSKEYTSYSGTDIVASIKLADDIAPIVIGELQTISYSTHREVFPVRTLSRINPVGFTNGPRTIAGSLIFTVFDRNIVYELLERLNKDGIYDVTKESILMDEMPPFDVTITMENEYGNQSCLSIRGIIIVDEGQVMSIEDMITENTMSFMAEGIEVLRTGGPSTSSSDTTSSGTVTDKMEPPGGPCTYTLDNGDTRFQFDKGKGAYSTEIILMKDKYDSKDTLTYNTQGEEVIMDNLKRDTKYFIKMRSKDKSGSMVSAWTTTEWWFVTSYTPGQPTNPSTVYIDKSGSKYARISYTKGNYSMKEQVSFAHGVFGTLSFKSCDDTPDADNVSGQSYFEIGPLTPGDHYYFKMRGVDSDNICSAWTTDPYNFTAPS